MDNIKEKSRTKVAETLRRLRREAGFTQKNIADVLNINRSTYTYYETGKTSPDLQTLQRISWMFGVPITIFFDDESLHKTFNDPALDNNGVDEETPKRIGELSPIERRLIAVIRAGNVDLRKVIDYANSIAETK